MANHKTVSIVIPAYNEEERLPLTLTKIAAYFSSSRPGFSLQEVIVVDDGSKDKTAEKAREFSSKLPMVVIISPKNRGKGNAVRTGMLAAKGDYVFMYDADAATPIEELARLLAKTDGADIVIGSRVGEEKEVVMTFFRRFVGWCFHTLCAGLLPGIGDASCGAKLWSREAAQKTFADVKLERFAFDIESLWLALRNGFKIAEVPVTWTAVPGSKVNIYTDSPEMFWSVVGLYRRRALEQKRLKGVFKKHWIAFVLALLVGLIYIAPHIVFMNASDVEYQGIYMSRTYDEDYYNGIIRQVYDGESVTQNAYNSEYQEKSISTMYNIPQAVVGHIGKFLGLSISSLALTTKFVFPALVLLVVYFFIYTLAKSRVAASIASFAMLLTQEIAPLNPSLLLKTFLFQSNFDNFLLFSRPINPQVNAIFFFAALWALAALWNNKTSKKYAIISGVLVGMLGYFYFYYWNFAVIASGVMLIWALVMKNKEFAKNILLSIVVGIVVASPFLFQMIGALTSDAASIQKNYVETHRFILEKVVLLPIIAFLALALWNWIAQKIQKPTRKIFTFLLASPYQFLLVFAFAGFIASNQQVIHGIEAQQHHYHFMTNIPVFILIGSVVTAGFIHRYLFSWRKIAAAVVLVLIAIQAVSIQTASYERWKSEFAGYQSYAPLFQWLNENSDKGDVVYSDELLSQLIPVYTHNDVYSALHMSVYPIPLERLKHNYFIYMYLEGVREQGVRAYLYDEENRSRLGQHLFEGQFWRATCGSFGCFPDATLDYIIQEYRNFLKTPFEKNLKKYRVDFVMWDMRREPEWGMDKYKFLEKIPGEGETSLWRVI